MFSRLKQPSCLWPTLAGLTYLVGLVLRVYHVFWRHPPEQFVGSDMGIYVGLARFLQEHSVLDLEPWQLSHPLGYPLLLSYLLPPKGSFFIAKFVQLLIGALIPIATGLLGAATFGTRTAWACVVVASLYFPFIEYPAFYLTETHFIFWLCIGFASLFAAVASSVTRRMVLLAAVGGVCLSLAVVMKAVALPALGAFLAFYGFRQWLIAKSQACWREVRRSIVIAVAAVLGALPIVSTHAAVCSHANRGAFCVVQNRSAADFLLGHYGRVQSISWRDGQGHGFTFGSPGAYLRRHSLQASVPFSINDGPTNFRLAWEWIRAHPGQAFVVSINHLYDAFLGTSLWPSMESGTWAVGDLFQTLFVLFLLFPTALAIRRECRRGRNSLLCSRTLLVFSPVFGLLATLVYATGEVRYRVPFDVFFIAIACAYFVGPLRPRESHADAP